MYGIIGMVYIILGVYLDDFRLYITESKTETTITRINSFDKICRFLSCLWIIGGLLIIGLGL